MGEGTDDAGPAAGTARAAAGRAWRQPRPGREAGFVGTTTCFVVLSTAGGEAGC